MTYQSEVLADNPSVYLRLNEAAGPVGCSVGSGVTGTAGAGVTFSQPGLLDGNADPCVRLTGTSGTITLAGAAVLHPAGAFSIECIFTMVDMPGTHQRVIGSYNGTTHRYSLLLTGVTKQQWRLLWEVGANAGGSTIWTLRSSRLMRAGERYHVVLTYGGVGSDGGHTFRLFINGELDQEQSFWGTLLIGTTESVLLGTSRTNLNGPSDLYLDEVAYYPAALSVARVAVHAAETGYTPRYGAAYPTATGAGAHLVTTVGQGKCLMQFDRGTGTYYPGHPDGWTTLAYDDSAWPAPVAYYGSGPTPPGAQWISRTTATYPTILGGRLELYRLPFTLATVPAAMTLEYSFDNGPQIYLNNVAVVERQLTLYGPSAPYGSVNLDPSLFVVGQNLLCVALINGDMNGSGNAGHMGLALRLVGQVSTSQQRSRAYLLS